MLAVADHFAPVRGRFDPFDGPFSVWTAPFLVFLAVAALLHATLAGKPSAQRATERSFWRDITTAFALWLFAVSWKALIPSLLVDQGLGLRLGEIFYAVHYVFMMRAVERRPHREEPWRLWSYERRLITPAAAFLVLGLATYFILLPRALDDSAVGALPSFLLYTVLDAYLAGRLLFVANAARPRRWRMLLGGLALTYSMILAVDCVEVLSQSLAVEVPQGLRWLKLLPFVTLTATAALRRVHFPPQTLPAPVTPTSAVGLTPPVVTLLWALVFPMTHSIVYGLGLVEPWLRPLREVVVLGATLLLGGLAVAQQRLLEGRARLQERQRRDIESALRSSEEDLRLILERRRAKDALRAEREKFRHVFRDSTDALALSRVDADGVARVVEVSRRFESLTGRGRAELEGLELVVELEPTDELELVVEQHDLATDDCTTDDRTTDDRATNDQHDPLRLTIVRTLSRRDEQLAEALEQVDLAIVERSAEGVVEHWNAAAERLFGAALRRATGANPNAPVRVSGLRLRPGTVGCRWIEGADGLPRLRVARREESNAPLRDKGAEPFAREPGSSPGRSPGQSPDAEVS